MKIIQRLFLKILVASITLSLSIFTSSAQTSHFRLKTADSLFQTKRYTQSLEHYEEILRQRQYSPAMLLKMAYINEGLNHIGPAMFYLNLYQIATNDKSVVEKMDELATKYRLEGYETTDTDRFWSFYLDYHFYISLALAALMILLFSVMYHTKYKLLGRPVSSALAVLCLSVILFVHQQFGSRRSRGIIADAPTYLMDGPSAGASVIDIVGDGHRVDVVGKKDVWLKIRWDDEIAYIKENSLKQVRL
ncbi:MAG: SH3 domain-containing protein [Cyclobacteriaceae bacterium]